ncbi:MAG: toxin-antitoxin system antitoxin component family protein [Acidocella sp. 20-61-6]|nr:MAG: toxin-antitoxin system antitoxin component family protein [Acidocella sp. 20-61-6]
MSQATHPRNVVSLLGRDSFDSAGFGVVEAVRAGLAVNAVDHLIATGSISANELYTLVVPRKTLANRRKLGRLTPEQSDRLVRVARVFAEAEATFASSHKAHDWLRRPTAALGGEAPLTLLDTDEGARLVRALLGRIDHGIAA